VHPVQRKLLDLARAGHGDGTLKQFFPMNGILAATA
jgi:hypothetical protein